MSKYSETLNLNMLWMAIQRLEKPKAHGQTIDINVLDYLGFLGAPVAHIDENETYKHKAVRLVAVAYKKRGKYDDDLQWELDLDFLGKNRHNKEELTTEEAEANIIKAKADAEIWDKHLTTLAKKKPLISDKIAKLSFVALLLTMTAAIF